MALMKKHGEKLEEVSQGVKKANEGIENIQETLDNGVQLHVTVYSNISTIVQQHISVLQSSTEAHFNYMNGVLKGIDNKVSWIAEVNLKMQA